MSFARTWQAFLLGMFFVIGSAAPALATSNTGPWGDICIRTEQDIADGSTIYPPQGDFETYMKEKGVTDLSTFVDDVECTKASAAFPGTALDSWPLKTPWGCYFVDQLSTTSDKVFYIPLNSKTEWDAFVESTKGHLKNDLLVRPCSNDPPPCPPKPIPPVCSTEDLDVVFVFDVSGSILVSGNFGKELDFVARTIDVLAPMGAKGKAYGGGEDDVPVAPANELGWVSFAEKVKESSAVGDYRTDGSGSVGYLIPEVYSLTGGMTAVGAGLERAYQIVSGMDGDKKIIVLISDGYNNQLPAPRPIADNIRAQGVTIVSVGVAGVNFGVLQINDSLLANLAGSSSMVLPVSFDQLEDFVGNLVTTICYDEPICN